MKSSGISKTEKCEFLFEPHLKVTYCYCWSNRYGTNRLPFSSSVLQLLLDAREMFSLFFLTALAPVELIKRTSHLKLLLLGSTAGEHYEGVGFEKKKDMSGYHTAASL